LISSVRVSGEFVGSHTGLKYLLYGYGRLQQNGRRVHRSSGVHQRSRRHAVLHCCQPVRRGMLCTVPYPGHRNSDRRSHHAIYTDSATSRRVGLLRISDPQEIYESVFFTYRHHAQSSKSTVIGKKGRVVGGGGRACIFKGSQTGFVTLNKKKGKDKARRSRAAGETALGDGYTVAKHLTAISRNLLVC